MKRDKREVKILVQPLYSMIIWLTALLVMVALLIFPNIFWRTELLIWKIVFNIYFSLMVLICAFSFFQITQLAIISESGIIIENIFGNIACIEWNKIVSITKEKLITYDSRGIIALNWLVIRTDNSQIANNGVINKRNRSPWLIKANKKNIATIELSLKLYCPELFIKYDS